MLAKALSKASVFVRLDLVSHLLEALMPLGVGKVASLGALVAFWPWCLVSRCSRRMKPPAPFEAGGPDCLLDQTQLIIVRGTTLPGLNLGNSTLIDAEIGRDVVLHLP
jgi:hypothetical protein